MSSISPINVPQSPPAFTASKQPRTNESSCFSKQCLCGRSRSLSDTVKQCDGAQVKRRFGGVACITVKDNMSARILRLELIETTADD